MQTRHLGLGAVAALALSSAGCAQLLAELEALDSFATTKTEGPSSKEQRDAAKDLADQTKDAVALARAADNLRDGSGPAWVAIETLYREALDLEPKNTYILAAQATAYVRQAAELKFSMPDGSATKDPEKLRRSEKYFKRATALLNTALKVNPNYGTAHFVIGEIYALQGDTAKALEKFDFVDKQKIVPEGHTSSLHAWRGYSKKIGGQEEAARADFELAMEFNEPLEYGEYADKILNPPKIESQMRDPDAKPVVRAR